MKKIKTIVHYVMNDDICLIIGIIFLSVGLGLLTTICPLSK